MDIILEREKKNDFLDHSNYAILQEIKTTPAN